MRIKESAVLLMKGGIIGIANIIPGLSGGTLAVILGIYDRLIEAIANFFKEPAKRKSHILFLLKIFLGALVAIQLLANVVDFMLTNYFLETMFLFMGLVLGGIPAVISSHKDMKIKTSRILAFVLGMILVLGISMLGKEYGQANFQTAIDPTVLERGAYLMLIVCGFLAGGAMIVPGISGSFILVLLGQYALVIASIKHMAVKPLACIAAGAAVGILVFSKIINLCLKKIPSLTYYFILGLIVASLYKIFPDLPKGYIPAAVCLGTFSAGISASYFLSKIK